MIAHESESLTVIRPIQFRGLSLDAAIRMIRNSKIKPFRSAAYVLEESWLLASASDFQLASALLSERHRSHVRLSHCRLDVSSRYGCASLLLNASLSRVSFMHASTITPPCAKAML